ncbi:medium-chain acyl-CoA ligase ACSF2, mitochondrial-like [Planococcus citri]|uniref:medium-chain acyl-CoA ligase ACSF2, mitochondrial-like n=1 Tax=Planococcus citri TaxID=170843 RepID=UPI0031F77DC6
MSTCLSNGNSCAKSKLSNGNNEESYLQCENLQKCAIDLYESMKEQKLSYYKGDFSEPLKTVTIGQLLEQAASDHANETAILMHKGQQLNFAQVLEKVDTLAAALMNLGLKRGDHVAIWGFNTVEWYLSFLAAFRAGFIVVNLNPLYEGPEVLACLNIGDVKAIIMDEKLSDRNFYDTLKSAIPEIQEHDYNTHITTKHAPLLKTVVMFSETPYKGVFRWNDLFATVTKEQVQKIKNSQSEISPFDICNIQFTSGTTSTPKGVLLTHHNLVNNCRSVGTRLELFEKKGRVLCQVPFFHTYGAVAGIFATIVTGSTLVIASVKFSPNKSIDSIIEDKCTVVYGTPTMHIDLIRITKNRAQNDPQIYDKMSSVQRFFNGGALILPDTIKQLKTLFKNAKFSCGYGMTETSPTTFISLPDDPDEVLHTTVGHILDHVEVKVVDDNNQLVPFGNPGEMCFRGYMVMKGYYKEPEKTKAVLSDDGWFRSGDRFALMENGYAQIVGRIKEIIIRGGENIEPKDIEGVIIQHPDIIDVQVYGVNDARLGEKVAAAIIKTENSTLSEADVKKYCEGKIALYKIPEYVNFCENYPKTASGKIQKFKLKEITEKKLQAKLNQ